MAAIFPVSQIYSARSGRRGESLRRDGVKTIRIPFHGASGQVGTGVASVPDAFCETPNAKSLIESGQLAVLKRIDVPHGAPAEVHADG